MFTETVLILAICDSSVEGLKIQEGNGGRVIQQEVVEQSKDESVIKNYSEVVEQLKSKNYFDLLHEYMKVAAENLPDIKELEEEIEYREIQIDTWDDSKPIAKANLEIMLQRDIAEKDALEQELEKLAAPIKEQFTKSFRKALADREEEELAKRTRKDQIAAEQKRKAEEEEAAEYRRERIPARSVADLIRFATNKYSEMPEAVQVLINQWKKDNDCEFTYENIAPQLTAGGLGFRVCEENKSLWKILQEARKIQYDQFQAKQ